MKVYIIRHGETAWNVQKRLQGVSDTELNEKESKWQSLRQRL